MNYKFSLAHFPKRSWWLGSVQIRLMWLNHGQGWRWEQRSHNLPTDCQTMEPIVDRSVEAVLFLFPEHPYRPKFKQSIEHEIKSVRQQLLVFHWLSEASTNTKIFIRLYTFVPQEHPVSFGIILYSCCTQPQSFGPAAEISTSSVLVCRSCGTPNSLRSGRIMNVVRMQPAQPQTIHSTPDRGAPTSAWKPDTSQHLQRHTQFYTN